MNPNTQTPAQFVAPPVGGNTVTPQAGQVQAGGSAPNRAPQARTNRSSAQNTLLISEVRDGIVIMSDGSFRSVIMVQSINFDLMSNQEREAVEYAYQGFLNSLYFPVQIFVRSRKVDMRPYIDKLDKIRSEHDNMLLALLMEDYIGFMEDVSQQTNIMDKQFYLVIPFFPVIDAAKAVKASKNLLGSLFGDTFRKGDQKVIINEDDLEKAKTELRNRVQSALNGLNQCNVQGIPLDTQELIELYYDAYNPDTATRQQLKHFDSLSAPVVEKGEGNADNPNLNREVQ